MDPNLMAHGTSNLDHSNTSYMSQLLLQDGYVFYVNDAIFEHDKVYILKLLPM